MTDEPLAGDVSAFLAGCVESFEEIEIALLLRRRSPDAMTAEAIADELRTTEDSIAASVVRLRAAGVLVSIDDGRRLAFRFEPRTPELRATLDRLAEAYGPRRLEIIRLMTSSSIERVRSNAARTFADAFLWGRRREDG